MSWRWQKPWIVNLAITIVAIATVVPLTVAVWLLHRDPLGALPRTGAVTLKETARERGQGRERRRIVLDAGALGTVNLRISMPDPMPEAPMPVVLVLGGLETGGRSACRLTDAGANVLIGYDWPVGQRLPQGMGLWQSVPELYEHLLSVPGQLAAALKWVSAQPWADNRPPAI